MKYIPATVSRKVAMTVLKGKKHSPTILFATGVFTMGATVVTACRATLKVDEILDGVQKEAADAGLLAEGKNPSVKPGTYDYSQDDLKRDKALIYTKGAFGIVKLYAPSIALGVISIACFTQSHRILSKRNAALTAAYAIVEKSFSDYRRRVVDEFGDDKDRQFYYGVKEETISEKTESGVKKTKVKTAAGLSQYARIFEESNPCYNKFVSNNEAFLRAQQEWANIRLHEKGVVLLNDVYDSLGFERTSDGCVVGWVSRARGGNDGYIDFGLGDWPNSEDIALHNDREVWLDFNVDGIVYDKV